MANLSFETAGTEQGTAADWTKAVTSLAEAIGVFNETASAFDPVEGFEKNWFLPMHVHLTAHDPSELISAADASDLPTAIALANDIAAKYRAHFENLSRHLAYDSSNESYFGTAVDLSGAIAIVLTVKNLLHRTEFTNDPLGHLNAWPGAPRHVVRVHRQEDVLNRVTVADPFDLATLITAANQVKAKLNAHIQLLAYGSTNDGLGLYRVADPGGTHIEFTGLARETGTFAGAVDREHFERGWSIPSMVPIKISVQDDMVDVDDSQSGIPWGGSGGVWGVAMWDGSAPIWPDGHEHLLDDLDLVSLDTRPREHFDEKWSLPGTGTPENGNFFARFFISGIWQFVAGYLATGILDTFDSGWKYCDVGLARYWSGTEWHFLQNQTEVGGFGSYSFGVMDLSSGGSAEAQVTTFSPTLIMKTTIGFSGDGCFMMSFIDGNGATQTCYWFIEETNAGLHKTTTRIGLTSNPSDPRYEFSAHFFGIKGITSLTPISFAPGVTGAVEWLGAKGSLEAFSSSDWTLTF